MEIKCDGCGAPLGIEDPVCPYCGKANPYFEQHRKDMDHYSGLFRKTRSDVYAKTDRYTHTAVYMSVLAILLLANILIYILAANSWGITSFLQEKEIDRHLEEHTAIIEQFLRDGEYIELSSYFEQNDLYLSDSLRQYDYLESEGTSLRFIFEELGWYSNAGKRYDTKEETAQRVSEQLGRMYEVRDRIRQDQYDQGLKQYTSYAEDMVQRAHMLVAFYTGLPKEEVQSLPDLSEAKRKEVIEKRLM